jgi:transposase-like protein
MRHCPPDSLRQKGGKEKGLMTSLLESVNHSALSVFDTPTAEAGGVSKTDTEVVARAVRRRFTAEYKQRILAETDSAQDSGAIGRILRREGLYSSHLGKWRKARKNAEQAALEPRRRGPKPAPVNPLEAELKEARRENAQLLKKLRTAELMIDLQKKVAEILGIALPVIDDDDEVNS